MLLNGKSVGKKKVKRGDCRTLFKVPYENGELTAVSYDSSGKESGRYSLKTAGERTELRILPETEKVCPNGLAFTRLEYTDDAGIWKPMERHTLKVTVENGILAGLGSACPYKKGSFGNDTVDTYFGDALAVVRANHSGPVLVTVTDETAPRTVKIPCVK